MNLKSIVNVPMGEAISIYQEENMTETKWPDGWNFTVVDSLEKIAVGNRFPVIVEPTQAINICENCMDLDRLMYSYLIVRQGKVHFFQDSKGNSRVLNASLQSQPCPSCNIEEKMKWLEIHSGLIGIELEGKKALDLRLEVVTARDGQSHVINVAKKLQQEIPNPKSWALFYGTNGIGKTHVLVCLANSCRVANVWAHYSTNENILRKLRLCYDNRSLKTVDEVRQYYEDAPVLIVDELDSVKWTDWAGEQLFAIIENRHMKGLPTWFASKKTPSELRENSTLEAIVSRISAGWLVGIDAHDQRADAWKAYADE